MAITRPCRKRSKMEIFKFRGKEYTLQQLAQNPFPRSDNKDEADQYDKLIAAANLSFKKHLWFAMFLKAGKLESKYLGYQDFCNYSCHPTNYAEQFYKDNPAAYLRGYYYPSSFIASNSYLLLSKMVFHVRWSRITAQCYKDII